MASLCRTHTVLLNLYQPATDHPSVLFCGSSYTCARHSSCLTRLKLQYHVSQLSLLAAYRAWHVLLQWDSVSSTLPDCDPQLCWLKPRSFVLVQRLVFLSKLVPPDFGYDRVGVGVLATGQHVGVALLLWPNPFGLRCDAPIEDLVACIRRWRRSSSIDLTTQWIRVTYVDAPPHSSSNHLHKSLPHTDPGSGPFCPPIRDQSYYGPQARL